MCVITATELKQTLGNYIDLSQKEDIIVKKNGKIVTMLTSPTLPQSSKEAFLSLAGAYASFDYESLLNERDLGR